AQVAGVEPALIGSDTLEPAALPISRGHVFAAHQNFAIAAELDFAAGQNFADGAFTQAKRMVHADKRRGLGEAIALDDYKSEAPPELFRCAVEGGAAADQRPELEAKLAMRTTKDPPAFGEVLRRGAFEVTAKRF